MAAATTLFVRDGYLRTTMADIAREAGVAVQTLYLGFGSKVGVLSAALDVAIAGDDEPVPVLERAWFAELVAEPDGRGALRLFVAAAGAIIERNYALHDAMRSASADPELAELWETHRARRFATHSEVARALSTKTGFSAALSVQQAAQTIYTLASQETYRSLVVEHGWTPDDWRAWVFRLLQAELFPHRAAS